MGPSGKLDPPAGLSPESKLLWERIAEENAIDAAAEAILRTLCEANDRRNEARVAIAVEGAVIKDRFGVNKKNPWGEIERDSTLVMHRAFRLLGFDQESRAAGDQPLLFG